MAKYVCGLGEDLKTILLEECEWKILRKVCFALLPTNMELLTALCMLIPFVYQAHHSGMEAI